MQPIALWLVDVVSGLPVSAEGAGVRTGETPTFEVVAKGRITLLAVIFAKVGIHGSRWIPAFEVVAIGGIPPAVVLVEAVIHLTGSLFRRNGGEWDE